MKTQVFNAMFLLRRNEPIIDLVLSFSYFSDLLTWTDHTSATILDYRIRHQSAPIPLALAPQISLV
jgi:hypothetical protein